MKKALVLGMGASGKAAARVLQKEGWELLCVDDKEPGWVTSSEVQSVKGFDLFVPAPGVPRTHPLYVSALAEKLEIAGEMELALRHLKDHFCIAVTGTNGKTTVVKLIEHVLNCNGHSAVALGNVGDVLIDYLDRKKPGEILVIEVSSFQLETLHTKAFDVGLILNITEDHLYRYTSFTEYAQTKCHLERYLKSGGRLIVYEEVAKQFAKEFDLPYEVYRGEEIGEVKAAHDRENATAAYLAVKQWVSRESFCRALETFAKPAHRIEFVACIGGVDYYNDSKATNVDAVVRALEAMPSRVLLLAGGVDKGGTFAPLKAFKEKVKEIFAFGESREKIVHELGGDFLVTRCEGMQEALERAKERALDGEVVLLSPGCASFDAFKNYAHRGEEFKKFVNRRI